MSEDMHESTEEAIEQEKLSRAVAGFQWQMMNKLLEKFLAGRRGWDDPGWDERDIKRQLIEHLDKGNFIDVANFAMFAFYRKKKLKEMEGK
jgi:hypothetical protein